MIEVRAIYRVVEHYRADNLHYSRDMDAKDFSLEVRYEWFSYVFEAALILCIAYLWNGDESRVRTTSAFAHFVFDNRESAKVYPEIWTKTILRK